MAIQRMTYLTNGEITLLACVAHARRKFEFALDNDKAGRICNDQDTATVYDWTFARENNYSFEQKIIKDKEAKPILEELKDGWNINHTVMPKSAIGIAFSYTLGLWKRLKRYIDDGRFEIDNNSIERCIRPVSIGRRTTSLPDPTMPHNEQPCCIPLWNV